jgi:large subunit ribosomal protein L21
MLAVIKTGGKQYVVSPNDTITIEKIPGEVGSAVVFDQVLLVSEDDGKSMKVGDPMVSAKVTAKITKQFRAKKVTTVKYKQKVHYRRTKGHRQHHTEVQIESIK